MKADSPFLSRRRFLRQKGCAALGLMGVVHSLTQMRLIHSAAAEEDYDDGDYKALVCLFLYGGNDANNTIVPMGGDYATYRDDRGILALEHSDLRAMSIPTPTPGEDRLFGMHPNLADRHANLLSVHSLFNTGRLAVVGNVGTLVEHLDQGAYLNGTAALPPQLYSHSDQQVHWQSSVPDQPFTSGWGGRIASLVSQTHNQSAQTSMSVSIAGHNQFMVGNDEAAVQLHLRPQGPVSLAYYGSPLGNPVDGYPNNHNGLRLKVFDNIMGEAHDNLFEEEFRQRTLRARANNTFIEQSLDGLTLPAEYPVFPNSRLGDQLDMIAQMIAARENLCQKRQLFFAAIGGFDTHANQLGAHANLMSELSQALGTFYKATDALGVADKVTTFTASDFGRTYTPNGNSDAAGSDHAWGGHAFVMGDAVQGRQIYGNMPNLVLGSDDDTETNAGGNSSRGRWIPSTSVDQYAATLAKWYGLNDEQLKTIFPNLDRFATPDLGFMG